MTVARRFFVPLRHQRPLDRMATLAGARYTLVHDGGGRVTRVVDPFNRPTTYIYDGSSRIRRIVDVGGRGKGDAEKVSGTDF